LLPSDESYREASERDGITKKHLLAKGKNVLLNNYKETGVLTKRRNIPGDCVVLPMDEIPANVVPLGPVGENNNDSGSVHPAKFDRETQEAQLLHRKKIYTFNGRSIHGVPKTDKYIGLRMKRPEFARRAKVVERFLKIGKIPVICDANDDDNYCEIVFTPMGRPILPLQVLTAEETGLIKTLRVKKFIDADRPEKIALEHMYKSLPHTVDLAFHYYSRLSEFLNSRTDMDNSIELLEFANEYETLKLVTFGSGGSCSLSGANAIGQNSGARDYHHTTGGPQLENVRENQAMMMLARTDTAVVAMFNM
jgi:hypothetical protein